MKIKVGGQRTEWKMASRASAQAMRQMHAMMCRPPTVRAAVQVSGRAAAGAGGGGAAAKAAGGRTGSTQAQSTVKRLMSVGGGAAGEGVAAGGFGGRTVAVTAEGALMRTGARSMACLSPAGTKAALALAKVLTHDDSMARALFGRA